MSEPLRICVFKWGTKYTHDHVRIMRNMLARNLTIPYEMVLISDQWMDDRSSLPADISVVPLWQSMREAKLCGVRLHAFHPFMAEMIGPRFAWIDLDVVITGNVDHIFSRTEPFVALSPPRPPMPINGSLVMMDAGAFPHVQSSWTLQEYHRVGDKLGRDYKIPAGTVSDEGWMWHTLGTEQAKITKADGVYYFRHDLLKGGRSLPADARMVVMNGRAFDPSMPGWQAKCPWIAKHWR
jgi:hypothetical protein